MGFEEHRQSWQEENENSVLSGSMYGYSPTTLPNAVPRRAPARIRLPIWVAALIWVAMLIVFVVFIFKVGQHILVASLASSDEVAINRQTIGAEIVPTVVVVAQPVASPTPSLPTEEPLKLATSWSALVLDWQSDILAAAKRHQFSPDLVAAIVNVESDGLPTGVSSAGAVGLMGVMPQGSGAGLDNRPTAAQLNDPGTNLQWGTQILARYLHQAEGDLALALAVYNGGWGHARTVATQTYALEVLHQTGYALATHAGVAEAGAIWGIEWEICPCSGETVVIDEVEVKPVVLFDDGAMRLEGTPFIVVEG